MKRGSQPIELLIRDLSFLLLAVHKSAILN
jgi:hypothetical protein